MLGDHVAQKGSLVEADRLRFDFSHPKPMSEQEIREAEDIANRLVLQNEPVVTRLMAVDEAVASGARALFGEKYGDEVRVVSMGTDRDADGKLFSVELCGGTHVVRTGDIGLVVIVSEGAVAAGVRRIEALTGETARRHLAGESRVLHEVAGILKTSVPEATERLTALMEERRRLERELADARRKLAMGGGGGGSAADEIREVSGVKYLAKVLRDVPAKDLKPLVDEAKKRVGSGVVAFVAVDKDERASLIVGVTPDQLPARNAVDLVRVGAAALGGKGGGGRPDMAQAGGPDGAQAEAALAAVEAALAAA